MLPPSTIVFFLFFFFPLEEGGRRVEGWGEEDGDPLSIG